MKRKDLTGQTFGRLTVVEYAGHAKNGNASGFASAPAGTRLW